MKFSVCLATGFEGLMYPIPFAKPADFVRQAQLCERLGYPTCRDCQVLPLPTTH